MSTTILTRRGARMGAPTKGVAHVDAIDGSPLAKERAKTILRLIGGELTRAQAAEEMRVSVRRVRQLREAMLTSAVAALEPGKPGRPRNPEPSAAERRVSELEATEQWLRWEIEASGVRERIAMVFPHLVRPEPDALGKPCASRKGRAKDSARATSLRGG